MSALVDLRKRLMSFIIERLTSKEPKIKIFIAVIERVGDKVPAEQASVSVT